MGEAKQKATPADLGANNFERVQRLLRAADTALMSYRACHNSPWMQTRKAALWSEYQSCLRELDEAIHA